MKAASKSKDSARYKHELDWLLEARGAPTVIVFLLWPVLTSHELAPQAMRETTQPSI